MTATQTGSEMSRVTGLRVEHLEATPLGVGTPNPRLSWRIETGVIGWIQSAWEIEATSGDGVTLWRSMRQEGRDSVLVPWRGRPLASRERCTWRVRTWGEDGGSTEWSEAHHFEVGLLESDDWSADMITAAAPLARDEQPGLHFKTSFKVERQVESARLHITALGVYEASVNGVRVGDHVLAPGWTAYRHRLNVQTFDVTDQIVLGDNVLESVVADGWFRGRLGFGGNRAVYGDRTGLLAQLEVRSADGELLIVGTGDHWEVAVGAVRSADLYDGETYDARVAPGPWGAVEVLPFDFDVLVPQASPPVRVTQVLPAVETWRSPSGRTIADFGQNLVGVVRLRVRGPAGSTVTLRHAEVLEDGELCTRILRGAQATDRYVLAGDGVEVWHPRFTFHGFRYVEITGWPGELRLDDIEALVVHTDMRRTGWFECSDDRVNRLHSNIVWGWRGNTVSLPTDCPQRDERLGWTGDICVFAETASFLFDCSGLLGGWLADLAAEQLPDGRVPAVVPDIFGDATPIYGAGWGDAAAVVPTVLHQWYGDLGVLRAQYSSMKSWVGYVADRAGSERLWIGDLQWGDWVDPTVDPATPMAARTDPDFVASAWFAHSADLLARAALVLDDDSAAERFGSLGQEIRDALRQQWVAPSGRIVADTQTGCALTLAFGLVEDRHRPVVAARLQRLVANEGHRVATGFLGTPFLLFALSDTGYVSDAFKLLCQTRSPSWLYAVANGATTIWERWEAMAPDGSLGAGGDMLSFNHYALGAIGAWMHASIGGLTPIEPGFRRFKVAPRPGGGMTSARVSFDSPYGRIAVDWSLVGCGVEVLVTVPPNTDAEVHLPERQGGVIELGAGHHTFRYPIAEDTYRRWVPPFSLETPLGELLSNPVTRAIVEHHLPKIAERSPGLEVFPVTRAAEALNVPGAVYFALSGALLAASPDVPAPPDEFTSTRGHPDSRQ